MGKGNGKGIYYWNNGDHEVSEYKNDKSHGKAIYHFKDGRM